MVSFANFQMEDGVPIYLQIVRHVKAGIVAGAVADGEEMPSRRVLSALLGVNPNTIQKAYRLLEDQGILQSRAGAKSCVAAGAARAEALRAELLACGAAAFVEQMKRMGVSLEEAVEQIVRQWDGPAEGGHS